jgi:membrane protein implicated in regulation of membrane protease activity
MNILKEFLRPELIWFLVGLVMLLLEFALPGLIIFFFGVGAWIVAAVCFFNAYVHSSINAQLLLFIASSILSLLVLRKWLKGIFFGHTNSEQDLTKDLEEFIGQKAFVKMKITPKKSGKIEFHGTDWIAEADEEIEEGASVEIIGKENITLRVKSV